MDDLPNRARNHCPGLHLKTQLSHIRSRSILDIGLGLYRQDEVVCQRSRDDDY